MRKEEGSHHTRKTAEEASAVNARPIRPVESVVPHWSSLHLHPHHYTSLHTTTPHTTTPHITPTCHTPLSLMSHHYTCPHTTTPPFTPLHLMSHHHTPLHLTSHLYTCPHTTAPLTHSFTLTSTCILSCVLKEDRRTVKMDKDSSKTAGTAEVPFLDRERQSWCLMRVRKGAPVRKTGPLFWRTKRISSSERTLDL